MLHINILRSNISRLVLVFFQLQWSPDNMTTIVTHVESGLNSEHVLLMSFIYTENCILVLKQMVLISRVVLILSGLNRGTSLYIWLTKQTILWGLKSQNVFFFKLQNMNKSTACGTNACLLAFRVMPLVLQQHLVMMIRYSKCDVDTLVH